MKIDRGEYRISIISDCNMKCEYCHNEGNEKEIKDMLCIQDIENIVKNSYNLGLKEIRLTGGEPLIHPQIYEICKMLNETYKLKVSINTNGILIEKLLYLINKKYITRVTVGLDYYDNKVSKNSPIGIPSKKILENILKIKKTGCNISIATVFNENIEEIEKIVSWGVKNRIRVKIIEVERNEIAESSTKSYIQMREYIFNKFNLKRRIDKNGEFNGYMDNFKVVSFFHSLCRLRRCDICKKIHLRITSKGVMKPCIFYSNQDENLLDGNIREKIKKVVGRQIDYHFLDNVVIKEYDDAI